jgi:hypothetical protein
VAAPWQRCYVMDGVADAAGWVPGEGTAGLAGHSAVVTGDADRNDA